MTRSTVQRFVLLGLPWSILFGCAGAPSIQHRDVPCIRDGVELPAPAIAGWTGSDSNTPPGADEWSIGDRLLFGVELDDHGNRSRWLVQLEIERLAPPKNPDEPWQREFKLPIAVDGSRIFGSNQMLVRVVVFDDEGQVRSNSEVLVPEAHVANGLFRACDVIHARPLGFRGLHGLSPSAFAEIHRSFGTLFALVAILENNESLSPILWKVVERPSFLSVLFGPVRLAIEPHFAEAHPIDVPQSAAPAFCLPVTLSVNEDPALLCHVVAARPTPPLRLAAGVVNVEGTHPYDPERRFSARLLAWRRARPSRFSMSRAIEQR